MFNRLKNIAFTLLIPLTSLLLLGGLLRMQGLQYLFAYTGNGFAKSLPSPEIYPPNAEKSASSCQSQTFNVLTYNVRYGSDFIEMLRKPLGKFAPGDYLPWSMRYPEIQNRIASYAPDLIGLQEMHTDKDIANIVPLQEYSLVSYHLNDFQYGDAALLYKKERFEMIDSGQFWLGPHSKLPFSLGFKPLAMIRYVNWALLREKSNSFTFIFLNTHFDNNQLNREKSSDLFNQNIVKLSEHYPMIVVGDFNSKAVTERYQRLIGSDQPQPRLVNAYDLHENKLQQKSHPNDLIDHIMVGGPCAAKASNWQVDKRPLENGETLSDHDPVLAQLHFTGLK